MKVATVIALALLAGCNNAPAEKLKEAAPDAATLNESTELKAKQRSIEEAADAAAKLVEEDANEEIGAVRGTETK